MDYYIDIQVQPDAEMRANVLLNKVYTKLHKTLHSLKATDIGVSFPQYRIVLGNIIRIHGNKKRLEEFQTLTWLGGMVGYCKVSEVLPVPQKVVYRTISRKQASLSNAKLRRLQKRGKISSPEEVKQYKQVMFRNGLDNPYMELVSASTGKTYRRYFQFGELLSTPVFGDFDSFGLSKNATVPWF